MPDVNYKFYLSKTNYEDYVFYLNPILYSEYDVQMEKSVLVNTSQDYDKISVIYAPTYYYNNNATTFNFIIQSPLGELENYGFNISFPGGYVEAAGSNAIGGQLSGTVNITGAEIWDTVRLDYYYTTTLAGTREFTVHFPIEFTGMTNNTFVKNKQTTYGLGIFERVLIATLVVIFVVGIATLVGQPVPGLGLGMLIIGFMVKIGFIPLLPFIITMVVGVLFLTWKSGG